MTALKTQKKIRRALIYIGIVLLIGTLGYIYSSKRISFLEFCEYGGSDKVIEFDNKESNEIIQKIQIPFELTGKISLLMTTYNEDNNSEWSVVLRETDTKDEIYSWVFNASRIKENEFFDLCFKNNIRLNSEKQYEIVIRPKSELTSQAVGFFCDSSDGQLRMRIYGGTNDSFWLRLWFLLVILLVLMFVRAYCVKNKDISLWSDDVMCMFALVIGYFAMMVIFAKPGTPIFSDENDNIYGGLVIANGATIYKDYITQHTPLAYWICAVFAKFGAHSVEQFRLLYYISLAIAWGVIYLLYAKVLGKRKMITLPFVQLLALHAIYGEVSTQILSDNFEILALSMLILEFVCYFNDRQINLRRMIIVGLSVFVSFGMAFLSLYAIVIVFVAVVYLEYRTFSKQKVSVGFLLKRYLSLIGICLVPFAVTFIILYCKGSLELAYDMAYRFNSEVYSYYIGNGFGTNKLQPFILGICNFFQMYCQNIGLILQAQCSVSTIIQIIVQNMFVLVLYKLYKDNNQLMAIVLFLFSCMCMTRENIDFHGLVFWSILLLALVLYGEYILKARYAVVIAVFCICIVGDYFVTIKTYAFCKQPSISDWESVAVAYSEDDLDIMIDGLRYDATYLIYKGRVPQNSMMFFLPWYMDWYEDKLYDEIEELKPKMVIYQPGSEIWGYTNFYNRIDEYIAENYHLILDNMSIYIRN